MHESVKQPLAIAVARVRQVQRLTVNKADHLVVLRAREVRTRSRTPFPPSCTSQRQTFVRASLLARSLAFCFCLCV